MSVELPSKPALSWSLSDFERKFWFPGSKQTHASPLLALLLGGVGTGIFFYLAFAFPEHYVTEMWIARGWIPYAIALFFFWGLATAFIKWRKLRLQERALDVQPVPQTPGYVLTPHSADQVLAGLYKQVHDPERFILFDRIIRALSNLKNLGRVSDVEVILRSQSESDANVQESSYTILKSFAWAMPVLGFIGTALGLSMAIGQFGGALNQGLEMSELRGSLKSVVSGLSIAFDTTLQGLVCTLLLQMVTTFLRKREEDFLSECDEYCHKHIIAKLRLAPHEGE
jgi:biopolymer transport protein ExbB/TolQ